MRRSLLAVTASVLPCNRTLHPVYPTGHAYARGGGGVRKLWEPIARLPLASKVLIPLKSTGIFKNIKIISSSMDHSIQFTQSQPQSTKPMDLTPNQIVNQQDLENNHNQVRVARGPISKAVLRIRGGEGHHCCAECCCFLCICCGIEELLCIEALDNCFEMCC
ncbi:hypothetical protein O181_058355 [Austropuccinia psidii MF-1]|uniref:Uncharacterized protein n=1 Tax=Austropuccinia psidii MF-1 TaxID=1389203 RepID=A0A9Q3E9I8_9BASI|nr:hypothetical protein [Austropuccinia psidii MF-1]